MFSGQLWGGFLCREAAQAIKLPSKPHLGGLCNPEPQLVPGKHCHSPKMDTDRRIQNKKGDHKSKGSDSPLKNQVLFSSYMSKDGSSVENSLSYTRLRGDREFRWKKWPPGKEARKMDLIGRQVYTPHLARRKKCGLSSKHHIFSNMSIWALMNTGVPQCKDTLNI